MCVGQSQDDSIVGMKQSKQIPPALPVSGNLSSSNPDLLQSHHRILDFNNQPGESYRRECLLTFKNNSSNIYHRVICVLPVPVNLSEYFVYPAILSFTLGTIAPLTVISGYC